MVQINQQQQWMVRWTLKKRQKRAKLKTKQRGALQQLYHNGSLRQGGRALPTAVAITFILTK